ncbi:MAG: sodium-dependent transporter [Phycisphaerae bacterium]|nr:sodium-dependent transporter [Phycisphaerae bacterium]
MAEALPGQQRENWGSRTGFVLAAIGSAVGLGNLWAFPYKVYDNGGGAFLIPYIIAMAVIGIPMLILEFSLGHMTQRAAPDAYRGVNRRTEPIGWWGIILGFVIITYYPVILAYCGSFLVECVKGIASHGGELAWKGQGLEGVNKHFFQEYLQMWQPAELAAGTKPWALGRLISPIVISLGVIWVLMYLCIFRGVKMVSKVVLLTVPLPWIMLLILTIRGLTLPGAARGLNFYLDPSWSELAKPQTWRWAFGQMFFSMSLAFGVMITYASFLHRKSDINNNAAIIGLADIGTSFIAGIAVFATLGAMSFATQQAGNPVGVTNVVDGGPGLAFVAFPYALAQLPYSAWFGAIFFIALLTLGIDSAFSITESVLASLVDKTRWSRNRTLIGMTLIGFGLGVVYCTRGGLAWIGAMDGFINEWSGIALLGLLECVVIGWAYRIKRLREHANERSDWKIGWWWDVIIRYVAPIFLSALAAWSLLDQASGPGGLLYNKAGVFQIPTMIGLIIAAIAPILAVILSMVHSPGADTHAQHVGQPRTGRGDGIVGCVLAIVAVAAIIWSFKTAVELRWRLGEMSSEEIAASMTYGMPRAMLLAAVGGIVAVIAVILGAGVVRRAEAKSLRPSGLARLSAGAGVMSVGCAGGLILAIFVMLHKLFESDKPAAAAPKEIDHLTAPSTIVLAAMLSLIVIGLGWCFYRALKAAGKTAPEQKPEGME